MPTHHTIELADRIVAMLVAGSGQTMSGGRTLPTMQPANVKRVYIPRYKLEELDDALRINVIAIDDASERATKSTWDHDLSCQMGLQRRLDNTLDETPQLDALLLDAETIVDYLRDKSIGRAGLREVAWEPMWDPQSLEEHNVFTAVARLTYRITR
jgi:hypothetical protein